VGREVSLQCLQQYTFFPIHVQISAVLESHPVHSKPVSIFSSHLLLGVPSCLFPSGFTSETLRAPCVYIFRDTSHNAPHYAVPSILQYLMPLNL